jgi:hypothetical protein
MPKSCWLATGHRQEEWLADVRGWWAFSATAVFFHDKPAWLAPVLPAPSLFRGAPLCQ